MDAAREPRVDDGHPRKAVQEREFRVPARASLRLVVFAQFLLRAILGGGGLYLFVPGKKMGEELERRTFSLPVSPHAEVGLRKNAQF